ncbi:hypothetical protein IKQ26_00820 [bacterium]|nr:hypothetical protein [bacterium]
MLKRFSILLILLTVAFFTTGAGYVGTLPDIEAEFGYLRKDVQEKSVGPADVPTLSPQEESQLKEIPRRNAQYVNIMIQKDKTSEYEKDVNEIIIILQKLQKVIYLNQNIQKFNAVVSNYIDHAAYLQKKYGDKKESNYVSFKQILNFSNQARSVAILWSESQEYQSFLPYTTPNNKYTKENLDLNMMKLQKSLEDTLFILKKLE